MLLFEDDTTGFKVGILRYTQNPQQLMYSALHQDYSEDWVFNADIPLESEAGKIAIKRLCHGKQIHAGVFEHPQMSLSCGYINHGTMQQLRTHRVGVTFDCQSMRYTSQHFLDVADGKKRVEDVFYLRSVGSKYTDRSGNVATYTEAQKDADIEICYIMACHYAERIEAGFPPEMARGMCPFDYRQHFVMSFNLRAGLHLLSVRGNLDAQYEIRVLMDLVNQAMTFWCPEIMSWYNNKIYKKAILTF